nr:MAG TPA: hypothetical protein [Caudoviricetes sp.]
MIDHWVRSVNVGEISRIRTIALQSISHIPA